MKAISLDGTLVMRYGSLAEQLLLKHFLKKLEII